MLAIKWKHHRYALQDKTTAAILETFFDSKSWNPLWQPKYFMADNYKDEIRSIWKVFPSALIILFYFISICLKIVGLSYSCENYERSTV